MADFSGVTLRATLLLKENIDGLLRRRGYHRKDLAQWCHKTEGWISKIYRQPTREIPLKYLDRIADFFGLTTFQLFQPGIVSSSERRKGLDRRARTERRLARRTDASPPQTSQTRAFPPKGAPLFDVAIVAHIAAVAAQLTQLSQELAGMQTAAHERKSSGKRTNVS